MYYTSAATFSIWSDEGQDLNHREIFVKRRQAIVDELFQAARTKLARGEALAVGRFVAGIAANRHLPSESRAVAKMLMERVKAVESGRVRLTEMLREGRQFVGKWNFGSRSGSFGMTIVANPNTRPKTNPLRKRFHRGVMRGRRELPSSTPTRAMFRIFDPSQPAEYRLLSGRIEYSPETQSFSLMLRGTDVGVDGPAPRGPIQTRSYLMKQDQRELRFVEQEAAFVGSLLTGDRIVLLPKTHSSASARLQAWEKANNTHPTTSTSKSVPIPPNLFPVDNVSAKTLLKWKSGEIRRFDAAIDSGAKQKISILQVQFSWLGRSLMSLGSDMQLRAWNARNGQQKAQIKGGRHFATSLKDAEIAVAQKSGTELFESQRRRRLNRQFDTSSDLVLFGPFGRRLFTAGADGRVGVFDLKGNRLAEVKHSAAVQTMAVSSDRKLLVTAAADRRIHVWNVENQLSHLGEIEGKLERVDLLTISPKGHRLLVAGVIGGVQKPATAVRRPFQPSKQATPPTQYEIQIWDLSTKTRAHSMRIGKDVSCINVSPNWKTAIVGTNNGPLSVWNLANGRMTNQLVGHIGTPRSIAVSADGRFAASGGDDGWIILWGLSTGKGSSVPAKSNDASQVKVEAGRK